MARPTKEARDSAAPEEVAEKSVEIADTPVEQSLSELLAQAMDSEPVGPAHGALSAISMALIELKRRAGTVDAHLRAEHAMLLERIQSL